MDYIRITITCDPMMGEIYVAELAELGFESFEEQPEAISAFIQADQYDESAVNEVLHRYNQSSSGQFEKTLIPRENWNALWEQNFQPITISDKVRVRATFHAPDTSFEHEIIIDPKMSFGTGHHSTTALMLERLLTLDLKGKRFLDLGTGTGILAIMAAKLGAKDILTTDIDDWCIENARENFERNGFPNIDVHLCKAEALQVNHPYEVVAANINKNVLLEEMPCYAGFLQHEGVLLLSGFYSYDLEDLIERAKSFDIHYAAHSVHNDWCQAQFIKS